MDFTIKGDPGSGKKVGNSVVIQRDKLSGGHRIWYATENSIIASSLIDYVNDKKFEDEIFIQPQNNVISNLAEHRGHFLLVSKNS